MKKINIKLLCFIAVLLAMSCKKDPFEAPKSATVNMSGRWWVQLFEDDGTGIVNPDYVIYDYTWFGGYGLATSNIASNSPDTLLISDVHDSWPFKVKVPINYSDLTFKTSTNLNIHPDFAGTGDNVEVLEGKILLGAAKAKSGRAADSIYLRLKFTGDDLEYIYSGHRDSGQNDDQY